LADAQRILANQLKKYKLCKHCLDRHGSRQRQEAPCYICRGLMSEKDAIIKKIISATRDYQFDTFLLGAVLPTQIYEREDAMRARLKIRGKESAKSQLTRQLGMAFAEKSGRKVDYLVPDLVINLHIDKENNVDVSTQSRPVTFGGRYKKKEKGFSQKQDRCAMCGGKGCGNCSQSGLSGYDSVEGVIARSVMDATGGETPRFTWLGSEDRSSLVLGRGRPFYVKVFNPRKRKIGKITVRSGPVVTALSPAGSVPAGSSRFTVKTRILVQCERALVKSDLQKIKSLAGAEVRFNNRAKSATKKIYSVTARLADDNNVVLTIHADGGLMIKQLVGGEEYMSPNISELLGTKCQCTAFDILDVHLRN
jgi:tRNA pseudouridine synthase 10